MLKKDCIFCQIVAGIEPALIVAENEQAMAIMDRNPIADGHVIVISKNHYKNFLDTPKEVVGKLSELV